MSVGVESGPKPASIDIKTSTAPEFPNSSIIKSAEPNLNSSPKEGLSKVAKSIDTGNNPNLDNKQFAENSQDVKNNPQNPDSDAASIKSTDSGATLVEGNGNNPDSSIWDPVPPYSSNQENPEPLGNEGGDNPKPAEKVDEPKDGVKDEEGDKTKPVEEPKEDPESGSVDKDTDKEEKVEVPEPAGGEGEEKVEEPKDGVKDEEGDKTKPVEEPKEDPESGSVDKDTDKEEKVEVPEPAGGEGEEKVEEPKDGVKDEEVDKTKPEENDKGKTEQSVDDEKKALQDKIKSGDYTSEDVDKLNKLNNPTYDKATLEAKLANGEKLDAEEALALKNMKIEEAREQFEQTPEGKLQKEIDDLTDSLAEKLSKGEMPSQAEADQMYKLTQEQQMLKGGLFTQEEAKKLVQETFDAKGLSGRREQVNSEVQGMLQQIAKNKLQIKAIPNDPNMKKLREERQKLQSELRSSGFLAGEPKEEDMQKYNQLAGIQKSIASYRHLAGRLRAENRTLMAGVRSRLGVTSGVRAVGENMVAGGAEAIQSAYYDVVEYAEDKLGIANI